MTLNVNIESSARRLFPNLALIHNGQRLFARDELDGRWHRHTHTSPEEHDTGSDGCNSVTLAEFLDEVEQVLAELDLP